MAVRTGRRSGRRRPSPGPEAEPSIRYRGGIAYLAHGLSSYIVYWITSGGRPVTAVGKLSFAIVFSLVFTDEEHGLAVVVLDNGSPNQLFLTSDGGVHWSPVTHILSGAFRIGSARSSRLCVLNVASGRTRRRCAATRAVVRRSSDGLFSNAEIGD
jgi:hypothetical protein